MTWNRRYQVKSYLQSSLWIIPLFALLFEQVAGALAEPDSVANERLAQVSLAGPGRIPPLIVTKVLSGAFSLKEFIESPNAAPNFAQKVLFI